MTPTITRNQIDRVLRRINGSGRVMKKTLGPRRVAAPLRHLAIAAAPINPSRAPRIVELTDSEICAAEFASWTIFNEIDDMVKESVLEECMDLFSFWTYSSSTHVARRALYGKEYVTMYYSNAFARDYVLDTQASQESMSSSACGCDECATEEESDWETSDEENSDCEDCLRFNEDEDEDEVEMCDCDLCIPPVFEECCCFANEDVVTVIEKLDDVEVTVEPEQHDRLLMNALLSTMGVARPLVPADMLRSVSISALLMDSLAALLFETRHLNALNTRFALPAPPSWMMEMDPPNTVASTVSLPSNWDALSARLSSSSLFNFFGIDPSGETSSISIPSSFFASRAPLMSQQEWDEWLASLTASSSTVSTPARFFDSRASLMSRTETASTVSVTGSASTLFPDPSEALSMNSTGSILCDTVSSSASSLCSICDRLHDESADSEYESDTDSAAPLLKKTSNSSNSSIGQTRALWMLAECDRMLEKIVEMRKKLRDLM